MEYDIVETCKNIPTFRMILYLHGLEF